MNDTIQQGLKGKLDKFSNLPSIPQIIVKIKQVAENPKATAADLANCILSDHQLTSRILRMANSAYYGSFSGKITTVTHGIVVMGFRAVHNIAISMALYDVVNSITKGSKFNLTAFWIRSLANGVIAKYLAQQINHTKLIEAAFIAGFMHDIGQVILAGAFPDKYEQISKLGTETPDIYTAERAILGIDHMEAGMLLARKWNLPSTLIRPILKHHRINKARKEKSKDILVDLVFIGDILYPYVMGGQHPQSTAYTAVVEQTKILINISDDCITELVASCHQQVAEIAQDLEINIEKEFDKCAAPVEGNLEIQQQLANKEVQLAFLQNSTDALLEAKSTDEILQVICEAILRGLQMGRVIIFQYDSKGNSFSGRVGFGLESQEAVQALSFSAKKGLFKYLREKGNPISIADADSEVYNSIVSDEDMKRLQSDAFVAIPIMILDKVQYAIFADAVKKETPINDETLRSMVSLAKQGGVVLERSLLRTKMKQ